MRYLAAVLFYLVGVLEIITRVVLAIIVSLGTLFVAPLCYDTEFAKLLAENVGFRLAQQCLDATELPPRTKAERSVYD